MSKSVIRERVALATSAVIARNGLHNTSMRDIASEAGCTTGVLTHYFRGKSELLQFAFDTAVEAAAARMRSIVAGSTGSSGNLLEVLLEALPLDERRRLEAAIYFGFVEAALHDADMTARFQDRFQRWQQLIAELIQCERPALAREEVASRAQWLLLVVDGIATGALAEPAVFTVQYQEEMLRKAVTRTIRDEALPRTG